jgi:hypothetical protein
MSSKSLPVRAFEVLKSQGPGVFFKKATNYFGNLTKKKRYQEILEIDSNKEKFTKIYQENHWCSDESVSGGGSELAYTEELRKRLPEIIEKYEVNTLVDAPCGDFNWMKEVVNKTDIRYIGLDIVDSIVEKNRAENNKTNVEFKVSDMCSDLLPDCDILFVRDCLFHLSFNDIDKFLKNIATVNYRYLFTTTHTKNKKNNFENSDIRTGDFRFINLWESPFNFPKEAVLEEVSDFIPGYPERSMVLIAKEDVPSSLS